MEIIYQVSALELLWYMFTNPLMVSINLLPLILAIAIFLAVRGRESLRDPLLLRLLVFIVIVTVGAEALIMLPLRSIGYGVDDGYIVVKADEEYRVPISSVNISLVSYKDVRPVYRVHGIGLPGLCLGKVRLVNGEKAVALIYKPKSKAIVIRYDGQVFVISHPGVEKTYEELMKIVSSWRTRES